MKYTSSSLARNNNPSTQKSYWCHRESVINHKIQLNGPSYFGFRPKYSTACQRCHRFNIFNNWQIQNHVLIFCLLWSSFVFFNRIHLSFWKEAMYCSLMQWGFPFYTNCSGFVMTTNNKQLFMWLYTCTVYYWDSEVWYNALCIESQLCTNQDVPLFSVPPVCNPKAVKVYGVAKRETAHIACNVEANPPQVSFQ